MPDVPGVRIIEVLTLTEAAEYLRVTEDALLALANQNAVPARKIGGEWRFLKRALADWLEFTPAFFKKYKKLSHHWLLDDFLVEDLAAMLAARLRSKLATPEEEVPKPGSKEAVRKHFGVWRDDPTAKAMVAEIYERRRGQSEGEE